MSTKAATPSRQIIQEVDTQRGLDRLQHLLGLYLDRHELSMRDLSLRAGDNAGLVKDLMSGRLRGLPRAKTVQGLARAMRIDDPMSLIDPSRPEPDLSRTPAPRGERPAPSPAGVAVAPRQMAQLVEMYGETEGDPFGYLRRDVVQRSLLASPEQLRVHLAIVPSTDGRVRRGDYLIVDASAAGCTGGGFSMKHGERGMLSYLDGTAGDETDGRIVGIIRPT